MRITSTYRSMLFVILLLVLVRASFFIFSRTPSMDLLRRYIHIIVYFLQDSWPSPHQYEEHLHRTTHPRTPVQNQQPNQILVGRYSQNHRKPVPHLHQHRLWCLRLLLQSLSSPPSRGRIDKPLKCCWERRRQCVGCREVESCRAPSEVGWQPLANARMQLIGKYGDFSTQLIVLYE